MKFFEFERYLATHDAIINHNIFGNGAKTVETCFVWDMNFDFFQKPTAISVQNQI